MLTKKKTEMLLIDLLLILWQRSQASILIVCIELLYSQTRVMEARAKATPKIANPSNHQIASIRGEIEEGCQHIQQLLRQLHNHTAIELEAFTHPHTLSSIKFVSTLSQQQDKLEQTRPNSGKGEHIYSMGSQFLRLNKYVSPPEHVESPVSISIQTRNNWIQEYLDHNDTDIYAYYKKTSVQVLSCSEGVIQLKQLHSYTKNKPPTCFCINQTQFNAHNKSVNIQLTHNRKLFKFGPAAVWFNCAPEQGTMLILIRATHRLQNSIRRVAVLRRIASPQMKIGSSFDVIRQGNEQFYTQLNSTQLEQFDSFYDSCDYNHSVRLPPGQYLFLPFSQTHIDIYATDSVCSQHFLYDQSLTLPKYQHLILSIDDEWKNPNYEAQFTRTCDYTKGTIMDVYRNPHPKPMSFHEEIQTSSQINRPQEDKQLLFRVIYDHQSQSLISRQNSQTHRKDDRTVQPKCTLVEYYLLTNKPAVVYQPKKKITLSNTNPTSSLYVESQEQSGQPVTIHSILK